MTGWGRNCLKEDRNSVYTNFLVFYSGKCTERNSQSMLCALCTCAPMFKRVHIVISLLKLAVLQDLVFSRANVSMSRSDQCLSLCTLSRKFPGPDLNSRPWTSKRYISYSALQNSVILWLVLMTKLLLHNQWLRVSNTAVPVHVCGHHLQHVRGNVALFHSGLNCVSLHLPWVKVTYVDHFHYSNNTEVFFRRRCLIMSLINWSSNAEKFRCAEVLTGRQASKCGQRYLTVGSFIWKWYCEKLVIRFKDLNRAFLAIGLSGPWRKQIRLGHLAQNGLCICVARSHWDLVRN